MIKEHVRWGEKVSASECVETNLMHETSNEDLHAKIALYLNS